MDYYELPCRHKILFIFFPTLDSNLWKCIYWELKWLLSPPAFSGGAQNSMWKAQCLTNSLSMCNSAIIFLLSSWLLSLFPMPMAALLKFTQVPNLLFTHLLSQLVSFCYLCGDTPDHHPWTLFKSYDFLECCVSVREDREWSEWRITEWIWWCP